MVSFFISTGILAICLGAWAFSVTRSDIQLILGAVGVLGGLALVGIGMILHRLPAPPAIDPYGPPDAS